jgi:hypothetical protein
VICNTEDEERDEIEGYLEKRNYAPEMFEVDRMREEQRLEYMHCINEMFNKPRLPLVFI